jgi:hypothetical protein
MTFKWPDFFSTVLPLEKIGSKMWRGLAVLTVRQGQAALEDSIDAVTGSRSSDRLTALHQLTLPMKAASGTAFTAASILAGKTGVRYFVHSITMSVSNPVGTTNYTTLGTISGTIGGSTVVLLTLQCPVPAAALPYEENQTGVLDVLLDLNTALTVARAGGGTFGIEAYTVTYQEIGTV